MYRPCTDWDSFSLITNYLLWCVINKICVGHLTRLKVSLRCQFDLNRPIPKTVRFRRPPYKNRYLTKNNIHDRRLSFPGRSVVCSWSWLEVLLLPVKEQWAVWWLSLQQAEAVSVIYRPVCECVEERHSTPCEQRQFDQYHAITGKRCKIQCQLVLTTNRKSHTGFWLVPSDLEWCNDHRPMLCLYRLSFLLSLS